jgi:hypothetical protein
MWELCLELFHLSNLQQPEYGKSYWDLYLKQGVEEKAEGGSQAQLLEAARRVQILGRRFFPNQNRFATSVLQD